MQKSDQRKNKEMLKIQFWSNWRFSNQICVFATFIFICIAFLTSLISLVLVKKALDEFNQSSSQMLNRESQNQLSKYIQLQQKLVINFFDQSSDKLKKMKNLFHFVQTHNLSIEQPYECYNKGQFYEGLVKDQFCYGYFGIKPENFVDNYFLQYTSLLTEEITILDFRQPYYTQTAENLFLAMNNGSILPSDFNPHTRGWYIDHLQNMNSNQEVLWSAPYFSAAQSIRFALTTNLTLINTTLVGVLGQGQELTFMPTLESQSIEFQMINHLDQLIISPLYQKNVTTFYQIHDENDTHINKLQWEYFKQKILNQKYIIEEFQDCYINKTYLLAVLKMDNPLRYLMLKMDNEQFKKSEERLLKYFTNQISEYALLFGISTILFCIVFLATQLIASNILNRDILNIMTLVKLKIYSDHFKKCILEKHPIRYHNQSLALYKAYHSLIIRSYHSEQISQKNHQCRAIERYQYPEKFKYKILQYIKQLIDKSKNCTLNSQYKKEILFMLTPTNAIGYKSHQTKRRRLTKLEEFISEYITKIKIRELDNLMFD